MIGAKWTGWDGSEWNLRSGPSVYLAKGALQGLGMPDGDVFTRETALSDGEAFTGWRAKARTMLLPIEIVSRTGGTQWQQAEAAFWKTMRFDKKGTLQVTGPSGAQRMIDLRFVDDGSATFEVDPSRRGISVYALRMQADDPWWYGGSFTSSFVPEGNGENFFGGAAGMATPFYLQPANLLANATLSNPGDIPAWPQYLINGPATWFRIIFNGGTISGTFALDDGDSLLVDTSPTKQIATITRSDGTTSTVTMDLDEIGFAPIPDGAQGMPLSIELHGQGTVTVLGRPKYYRAW